MYYIKATGDNRYGQGTDKWLRIRRLVEKEPNVYEAEFRLRGRKTYVLFTTAHKIDYLKFAEGWPDLKPVSVHTVIQNMIGG